MKTRATNRWRGVTALSFAAGALGIVTSQPAVLLLAVVGVAYAAYARLAPPPEPTARVERTVDDDRPDRGDAVGVTVELTNDGDRLLPDLRVVDGVPPGLAVVDGSPRLATALRPGKRASFSYEVEAIRGTHDFEPTQIIARGVSGAVEHEDWVRAETAIRCVPRLEPLDSFPLRKQTVQHTGQVTTDVGGGGVEFHATRRYRPGDPIQRIDWHRAAKTGELTTVEFREERAATVVLLVDSREPAYVADLAGRSAVENCVTAGGQVASALLATGDRVGVASLGPRWSWLAPGLGRVHRTRLAEELALAAGFAPTPPDEQFFPGLALRRVRKHLPGDAQVVLFSPLSDAYPTIAARRLEAHGHLVTVVSPDVVDGETDGAQIARLERDDRLRTLRRAGIRVLDWDPDRPLAAAVTDATRRWRQ